MSTGASLARQWICDGCGVTASRIDREPVPLPAAWVESADGRFCLVCRRQRAAEAALDAAPSDSPADVRVKLRRAALIEFEVTRTPEETDGTIARACRTSAAAVTRTRRRLQLPDPPSPSAKAKSRATASPS